MLGGITIRGASVLGVGRGRLWNVGVGGEADVLRAIDYVVAIPLAGLPVQRSDRSRPNFNFSSGALRP